MRRPRNNGQSANLPLNAGSTPAASTIFSPPFDNDAYTSPLTTRPAGDLFHDMSNRVVIRINTRSIQRLFILAITCIVLTGVGCGNTKSNVGNAPISNIIPRPKVENLSGLATLATRAESTVGINLPQDRAEPVNEGALLLARRLQLLDYALAKDPVGPLVVRQCTEDELQGRLESYGRMEKLDPDRMKQAYRLLISGSGKNGSVIVEAPYPLGIYYGIVSLCQLLSANTDGDLVLPTGEVVDYPEIAIRLANTSGTLNPPDSVALFADWLPLFKLSHIGLQYHGEHSRDPEPIFNENISKLCPETHRKGILKSFVYFCPFRGLPGAESGQYDFKSQDDRQAYAEYLRWIMSQGADGIEVDYNDWPGTMDTPISDVLNLACDSLWESYPDAYILYCPPIKGDETYHGMASQQLGRTLSEVPSNVMPLWTGMDILITEKLTDAEVREWTRIAGRKPFLWVNRVGYDLDTPFARKVGGENGGYVFEGDLLPENLHELFGGVHLSAAMGQGYHELPSEFETDALVYMTTAADYLWNPGDWDAEESLRRARHFVSIMLPAIAIDIPEFPNIIIPEE